MNKTYIQVGSITYAMSGNKLLYSHGIFGTVIRNVEIGPKAGCGYSIMIKKNVEQAIDLLKEHGYRIKSIIKEGGEHVVF